MSYHALLQSKFLLIVLDEIRPDSGLKKQNLLFNNTTGLLARSQYSEGPATGHLDTGFSWFPCVYKQTLRWFPTFQVATTCFSHSPLDLIY